MPSKKKKKKGPRNTAKADNKKDRGEDKEAVTVVAVDSSMQRLKIDDAAQDDDDKFLDEAIQLAAAEKEELKALERCCHGYSPQSDRERNYCDMFAATLIEELFRDPDTGRVMDEIACSTEIVASAMTATAKKFPGVWKNEKKLKLIKSFCLSYGAEYILIGDIKMARYDAFTANFLEQFLASTLNKAEVLVGAKLAELFSGDQNTLVSYFRKRIPCSCLDQKYAEVKSIKKMGQCQNPTCRNHGIVERSTMLSCTRCRWANYCSRECQAQHWTYHKNLCDNVVTTRAAFDSKR